MTRYRYVLALNIDSTDDVDPDELGAIVAAVVDHSTALDVDRYRRRVRRARRLGFPR